MISIGALGVEGSLQRTVKPVTRHVLNHIVSVRDGRHVPRGASLLMQVGFKSATESGIGSGSESWRYGTRHMSSTSMSPRFT